MGQAKIIYKDVAVGGVESTTTTLADIQPFCGVLDFLQEDNKAPQFATLEQNYWVLGNKFRLFPDQPQGMTWGLWSKSMAGENGMFATPPTLILDFDKLFSSVGVSLTFDPYGPTWCNDLNITWSRNGTTLATKDFQPNAHIFSCINEVQNFNRIVIRFKSMSAPWRYLKLQSLVYGITRTFGRDEFFGLSLLQESSPLSEEVAYNVLDFSLRNKSAVPFLFQRKQPLEMRDGDDLLGVFYISTAKRTGANAYDIAASDIVRLMDEASKHRGGIYVNALASAIIAEIMTGFEYELDPNFSSVRLYGWLPIASRRENLAQVAFAIGAMVDASRSGKVRIFKESITVKSIIKADGDRAYAGCTIDTAALVTGVRLMEHQFTAGTETQELYKDPLNGTAEVTFSEPMCALSVAGGTIVEQNPNYAVIRGTGATVTLTGTKYNHSTRPIYKANPLVGAVDIENVIEVDNSTLVGPNNSAAVSQRVYDYYQRRNTLTKKIILGTERPGDRVQVETDFDGVKLGTIKSLDITPGQTTAAEAVILCDAEVAK